MNNEKAISIVREWYEAEPDRYRSRIGIPNAGLHVIERFRANWPVRESHYLTPGGGQISGMSGASGDLIVARFATSARSLGSEAGRTSRSTPAAARRLAARLNRIHEEDGRDAGRRGQIADVMQEWLVTNVLLNELSRVSIPRVLLSERSAGVMQVEQWADLLTGQINDWNRAAVGILAASCDVLLAEKHKIAAPLEDSEARADLQIEDTALIAADIPTPWVFKRCRAVLSNEMLCVLIVPEKRLAGACQLTEAEGLADSIDVESLGRFVIGLTRVKAGFGRAELRRLMSDIVTRANALVP